MGIDSVRRPTVLMFAGPNGSGKSTIARALSLFGTYINTDDFKRENNLTDLEAAQYAEALRNELMNRKADFSFETVLSTDRNLILLQKAKESGYEIQCIYVLTCNPDINVARVRSRVAAGGHDVPEDKIRSRYHRALALIPQLISVCDKILIYDNSESPSLIFKKETTDSEFYVNQFWSEKEIRALIGLIPKFD